jgi:hypothetical protein
MIGHGAIGVDVEEMRVAGLMEDWEDNVYEDRTAEKRTAVVSAEREEIGVLAAIGGWRKAIGFSVELGHG